MTLNRNNFVLYFSQGHSFSKYPNFRIMWHSFFGIFFSQKGYFIDNVIYIFEKENIFFTYFFAIKSSKRHYFLMHCKYSQFIRKILRFISIIIIHIIWNEHNCYYYCKIMVCIILTFYMTITCIYMVDSGPDVSHITLNELGHLQHEP